MAAAAANPGTLESTTMNELELARHNASVDPVLHVWGWEVPAYLFLGGLAAGVMIASSLLTLRAQRPTRGARLLSFAAPVLVSLGMGALFLDLENKLHVLRFYAAFRPTSPMSWGAWILVLVYPVSLLFSLGQLDAADADRAASWFRPVKLDGLLQALHEVGARNARRLALLNAAIGAGLGVYTGILLSTLVARPLWNSALLGPLFLVSGLSTGTAFLMLFNRSEDERHTLGRWDAWAIGAELVLLALFLIGLVTSGAETAGAAELILGGRFTAPFWAIVVLAGLLVPLTLEGLAGRVHKAAPLVAPALVLIGGFGLRWILVAAGQA